MAVSATIDHREHSLRGFYGNRTTLVQSFWKNRQQHNNNDGDDDDDNNKNRNEDVVVCVCVCVIIEFAHLGNGITTRGKASKGKKPREGMD